VGAVAAAADVEVDVAAEPTLEVAMSVIPTKAAEEETVVVVAVGEVVEEATAAVDMEVVVDMEEEGTVAAVDTAAEVDTPTTVAIGEVAHGRKF